jgi:two-component system, cell cycle sensor histidine kinase and response regulator CckA
VDPETCAVPVTDMPGREAGQEGTLPWLRRAERMDILARLANAIAHDLANHLSVVLVYARNAQTQHFQRDSLQESLDEIHRAATGAAQLTERLSWFGRRNKPRTEAIDLNIVVEYLAEFLRLLLRGSVGLDLRLEGEPVVVRADRSEIEDMVMNLCVNALDIVPKGGQAVIRTRGLNGNIEADGVDLPPGDYVALEVDHSGATIPTEPGERIFEPVSKSTPRGRVPGLHICRTIAKGLGGDVRVRSGKDGRRLFQVILPRAGTIAAKSTPSIALRRLPTGTETVLVVEDESSTRRVIARQVGLLGYCVLDAEHGSDALRLLETRDDINLLLTDVVMPGLSGPELAEAVRARKPGMKVVYMSAYMQEDLGEALTLPTNAALLQKPFDQAQLAVKLREALDRV